MPLEINRTSPMLDNSHRNVRIRIELLKLYEIDCANKKFSAELLIESKWNDFNLNIVEYDQTKHWCFKMNEYDMHKHWNPRLYIKNQVGDSKEQAKYKIHKESNFLIVTETKTIKGQFWQPFKLNNFPFDIHELNMVISSRLNSSQITLIIDSDKYALINSDAKKTFTDQNKWHLYQVVKLNDLQPTRKSLHKHSKSSTFVVDFNLKKKLNQSPIITATAYCSRKSGGSFIFETFFLAFLLGVLSLTIFSVSKLSTNNRLQLSFLILISNVVYKWCFSRTLNTDLNSSTILDKYSICCIVLVCAQAIWHSLIGSFYSNSIDSADLWVLIAFACLFSILNLAILIWFLIIRRKTFALKHHERRLVSDNQRKTNKMKTIFEDEDEDRY